MSGPTPAVTALILAGAEYQLHRYATDPDAPSYGGEAAQALGVAPERVHKTLVAEVDGRTVLAVVPVSGELDLRGLARARQGRRAVLVRPDQAERVTGGVVGGISPLGLRRPLPVVIDAGATVWPTVFVSAGRRGLEVELAPAVLIALTGAVTAPLFRRPG